MTRRELECSKDLPYAILRPFGDLHLGDPYFRKDLAQQTIDECLETNSYVILMGDMCEIGTRSSVGDSVYEQTLNPNDQFEELIELIKPLADRGLILGYVEGNHERRIINSSSINMPKFISKQLGFPFKGPGGYWLLTVNGITYSVYANHGKSRAATGTGKINAVRKIASHRQADIVLMGHVHDIKVDFELTYAPSKKTKQIVVKEQILVVTGHYRDMGGYTEEACYAPTLLGSPTLKLRGDRHKVQWEIN